MWVVGSQINIGFWFEANPIDLFINNRSMMSYFLLILGSVHMNHFTPKRIIWSQSLVSARDMKTQAGLVSWKIGTVYEGRGARPIYDSAHWRLKIQKAAQPSSLWPKLTKWTLGCIFKMQALSVGSSSWFAFGIIPLECQSCVVALMETASILLVCEMT